MPNVQLKTNLKLITSVLTNPPTTTQLPLGYMCFGVVNGKAGIWGNYDNTVRNLITEGLGTAATKDIGTSSGNVPVLDSNGKLDTNVLPALAITDVFVVADQAAMLALTAQPGDVAIRTDLNKSFILQSSPASTLSNWKELLTPTNAVVSVNGKTGTVTITASDVGLGNVVNTGDSDTPVSGGTTKLTTGGAFTALAGKIDKTSPAISINEGSEAIQAIITSNASTISQGNLSAIISSDACTVGDLSTDRNGRQTIISSKSSSTNGNDTSVISARESNIELAQDTEDNSIFYHPTESSIIGGYSNQITAAQRSVIAGGSQNSIIPVNPSVDNFTYGFIGGGQNNLVKHRNSATIGGMHLTTFGPEQVVMGKYNDTTLSNVLFAIGNGSAENNRSNALTVYTTGKVDVTQLQIHRELVLSGGDAASDAKIALDQTNGGQITDKGTKTLFGFTNNAGSELKVGSSSYSLALRGSGTRFTYNGNDIPDKTYVDNADANKVNKTTTIAGVDLQDNITKSELLTALNVADGAQVNTITSVNGRTGAIDTYKGAYSSSVAYKKGDLVTDSDIIYLCIADAAAGTLVTNTSYFKPTGKDLPINVNTYPISGAGSTCDLDDFVTPGLYLITATDITNSPQMLPSGRITFWLEVEQSPAAGEIVQTIDFSDGIAIRICDNSTSTPLWDSWAERSYAYIPTASQVTSWNAKVDSVSIAIDTI